MPTGIGHDFWILYFEKIIKLDNWVILQTWNTRNIVL